MVDLMEVDWVATEMVHPMEVDWVGHPPRPLTNAQVCFTVAKALGMRGLHFSLTPPKGPLSKLYNRLVRPFFPYLQGEPTFASSVSDDCPGVVELVEKIVRYWRSQQKETS